MYARGMSVRDIQAHLTEIYGADISPSLISTVIDAGRQVTHRFLLEVKLLKS